MQPLPGAVVEVDGVGVGVGLGELLGLELGAADGELDGLELGEPDGLALGLELAVADALPLAEAEADASGDGFLPALPDCGLVTPGVGAAEEPVPPLPVPLVLPAGATWEIPRPGTVPDGDTPPVADVAGTGFAVGAELKTPETSTAPRAAPARTAAPTATAPIRRRRSRGRPPPAWP